uniref:Uncharacterized protein n=1 Tax=Panstrongylus lignarius TaxID=156445 RepID=A0A224Y0X0_9HEMI
MLIVHCWVLFILNPGGRLMSMATSQYPRWLIPKLQCRLIYSGCYFIVILLDLKEKHVKNFRQELQGLSRV